MTEDTLNLQDFREVPGFSRYLISREGVIFDQEEGKIVKHLRGPNFWQVRLWGDDEKWHLVRVHRVLVDAFESLPEDWVVWPWNGDYFDLRWENLRWGTQSEYRRWTIERPDGGIPVEEHIAAVFRRLHFRVKAEDVTLYESYEPKLYAVEVDLLDLIPLVERKLKARLPEQDLDVKFDPYRGEFNVLFYD